MYPCTRCSGKEYFVLGISVYRQILLPLEKSKVIILTKKLSVFYSSVILYLLKSLQRHCVVTFAAGVFRDFTRTRWSFSSIRVIFARISGSFVWRITHSFDVSR